MIIIKRGYKMKKGLILTAFILALAMYVVLVFALTPNQDILINSLDNSTNISVIIAPPINPLTNIFYGGTRIQTVTNSKSGYTNGYSKSTEQISHCGDRIQTETNSKSEYTNGYN